MPPNKKSFVSTLATFSEAIEEIDEDLLSDSSGGDAPAARTYVVTAPPSGPKRATLVFEDDVKPGKSVGHCEPVSFSSNDGGSGKAGAKASRRTSLAGGRRGSIIGAGSKKRKSSLEMIGGGNALRQNRLAEETGELIDATSKIISSWGAWQGPVSKPTGPRPGVPRRPPTINTGGASPSGAPMPMPMSPGGESSISFLSNALSSQTSKAGTEPQQKVEKRTMKRKKLKETMFKMERHAPVSERFTNILANWDGDSFKPPDREMLNLSGPTFVTGDDEHKIDTKCDQSLLDEQSQTFRKTYTGVNLQEGLERRKHKMVFGAHSPHIPAGSLANLNDLEGRQVVRNLFQSYVNNLKNVKMPGTEVATTVTTSKLVEGTTGAPRTAAEMMQHLVDTGFDNLFADDSVRHAIQNVMNNPESCDRIWQICLLYSGYRDSLYECEDHLNVLEEDMTEATMQAVHQARRECNVRHGSKIPGGYEQPQLVGKTTMWAIVSSVMQSCHYLVSRVNPGGGKAQANDQSLRQWMQRAEFGEKAFNDYLNKLEDREPDFRTKEKTDLERHMLKASVGRTRVAEEYMGKLIDAAQVAEDAQAEHEEVQFFILNSCFEIRILKHILISISFLKHFSFFVSVNWQSAFKNVSN